jgi:hypothetical protein
MGLFARNYFTHGYSTFMTNLIISSGSGIKKEIESLTWVLEYMHGLGHEIYAVEVKSEEVGHSFIDLVKKIYLKNGTLLIGVQSLVRAGKKLPEGGLTEEQMAAEALIDERELKDMYLSIYDIYINPIDYKFKVGDMMIFISKDARDAENYQMTDEDGAYEAEVSDPEMIETFNKIEMAEKIVKSKGDLDSDHYMLWKNDMRGKIWNHILVIGKIEHYANLLDYMAAQTNQYVCYISDQPPDERWLKIRRKFSNAVYFECDLRNIEELARTGINFAAHSIL